MAAQSRVGCLIDGRYRLQEKIGEGRLSSVHKALDTADGDKTVVVKLLDTQHPDLVKRELFKRETASLKRLRHPNIISLQQSGWSTSERCFYLVLDYVPYSLDRYLDVESRSQPDSLNSYSVIRELTGAVAYAHAHGVIHRDIKPANILIDKSGRPQLADFGISKLLNHLTTGQTLAKYWSSGYASPEQRASQPACPESDIYSLGAVFYHLLSKQAPPPEGLTQDSIDGINVPIRLRNVLRSMLERDPEKRGYDCSSLVESLETITRQAESLPHHYLHLTRTAINSLTKEGYIGDRDSACKIIQENLGATDQGEVHIHKDLHNSGKIQILGDSLRLICAPHDSGALSVITVHTPNMECLARERERAMPYRAIWEATQEPPPDQDRDSLNSLLTALETHHRENVTTQKQRRSRHEFIQQWLDTLHDKKRSLQGEQLEYEKVEQTTDGLRFTLVDPPPDNLGWAEESALAVEARGKKRQDNGVGDLIAIQGTIVDVAKPNRRISKDDIPPKGKIKLDVIQARALIMRQIDASYNFLRGEMVNPKLADVVVDTSKATRMPEPTLDFYQDWLSTDKKLAVRRAIASNELFLIRGPPGTGKTAVIAEIVLQILKRNPDARILLSSQSNVAVDHALTKIAKITEGVQMIRMGRTEKIGPGGEKWTIDQQARHWHQRVQEKCNLVITRLKQSEHDYRTGLANQHAHTETPIPNGSSRAPSDLGAKFARTKKIRNILEDWVSVAGVSSDFKRLIVEQSNVVGATCVFSGRREMPEADFDWVVIDEAGRATLPETLIPMAKAERAILVGDERQLPPMIDEFNAGHNRASGNERLDKSLFQSLVEEADSVHTASLNTQYRMHPAIGKLISAVFYEGKIKQGTKDTCRIKGWMKKPVTWLSTSGMHKRTESRSGSSFSNVTEAHLIMQKAEELERVWQGSELLTVGIISAYAAQVGMLHNMIRPNNGKRWRRLKIEIATVDAFQGRECDVIIYSTVRSNRKRQIGFQRDYRRINVALSRARNMLVVVGDSVMMRNAAIDQNSPFAAVLKHLEMNREDCDIINVNQVKK